GGVIETVTDHQWFLTFGAQGGEPFGLIQWRGAARPTLDSSLAGGGFNRDWAIARDELDGDAARTQRCHGPRGIDTKRIHECKAYRRRLAVGEPQFRGAVCGVITRGRRE